MNNNNNTDELKPTIEEVDADEQVNNNNEIYQEEDDVENKYNDIYSVLSREARDFYIVNEIERIEKPTPLEFYREYVSQNKPVIITGVLNDWKALKLWSSNEYLRNLMKDEEVTVAVTPDGFGDAVKLVDYDQDTNEFHEYFVKPLEKKIKFQEYIDYIDCMKTNSLDDTSNVQYIQYQNDSFNQEYQKLWNDIDHTCIAFARDAFGVDYDAINFWMGDERAVSSLHKDPYENIYCVVRGTKVFTLLPPIDYPFLYEKEFIAATYVESKENPGELVVEKDVPETKVPWIPVDPVLPLHFNASHGYPLIERAHPITIEVNEGEILYLPSLYYHRVAQKGPATIAINYWFDMKYSLNYVYFQFLKQFKDLKINTSK
eukprot:gene4854-6050_t